MKNLRGTAVSSLECGCASFRRNLVQQVDELSAVGFWLTRNPPRPHHNPQLSHRQFHEHGYGSSNFNSALMAFSDEGRRAKPHRTQTTCRSVSDSSQQRRMKLDWPRGVLGSLGFTCRSRFFGDGAVGHTSSFSGTPARHIYLVGRFPYTLFCVKRRRAKARCIPGSSLHAKSYLDLDSRSKCEIVS